MSPIIKARGTDSVRPFGAGPVDRPSAIDRGPPAEPTREDSRLEQLARENMSLKEQLSQLAASLDKAARSAREEGRREAAAEAQRDERARITALQAGVADALAAWDQRLSELETLAALMSRTALAKLFERPDKQSELVLECLARQLNQVRQQTVVGIRVSAHDFPDEAVLAEVSARSGQRLSVSVCPELTTGECRLDLQVGHVDIGPATQWARLGALLDGIAEDRST